MTRQPLARLAVLAALGLAALLSLLALPVETLVPQAAGVPGLRALSLVQPGILLALALLVGHRLAPGLGLGTPLIDAALAGGLRLAAHRAAFASALAVAVAVALLLLGYGALLAARLADAGPEAARLLAFRAPLVTRLLWGGVGEELLMRWGLMTLLLWAGWRLAGRPAAVPAAALLLAIGLSAALFAAGHLPVLFLLMPDPPAWLLAAVLVGNLVPGLLFGWLYARHGLESAMLAHGGAHLLAWMLAV